MRWFLLIGFIFLLLPCYSACGDSASFEYEDYAIADLITLVSEGNAGERVGAVSELMCRGSEAAPAVPQLINNLDYDDYDVRLKTIWALTNIATNDEKVTKAILPLVSDDTPGIRPEALKFLARTNKMTDEILSAIEPYRKSRDYSDRLYAEYVFLSKSSKSQFDDDDTSLFREVIETGIFKEHRYIAIDILGRLAPRSQSQIPLLTSLLEDDDYSCATSAACALGEFGALAKPALPHIERFYNNADQIEKKLGYFRNNKLYIMFAIGKIEDATNELE